MSVGLLSRFLFALTRLHLLMLSYVIALRALAPLKTIHIRVFSIPKRRCIAAMACMLPLLSGYACVTQNAYLVTVDGLDIGLVADDTSISSAIQTIESDVRQTLSSAYTLPHTVSYKPVRALPDTLLTQTELVHSIVEETDELDMLAVISVEGNQVGACESVDEAQTLLDAVKAQYTSDAGEHADFLQTVSVRRSIAPTQLQQDYDAMYTLLSHQLDVTSTRSLTYTEEIPFETITQENNEQDQTYRSVVQSGQPGTAVVIAEITSIDGEEQERTIVERTVLNQAQDEVIEVGTKNIGIGSGAFVLPIHDYTFTSAFKWRWGRLHSGVDLAAPEGTTISAADNGTVILAEYSDNGYGYYVIIDHQNGFKTLYGHNSELLVSVGDIVAQGDSIALSGNTGNSTGPHLHFEIHVNDEKVDPALYLTF